MSLEPTAPRPAPAFTVDEERPITGRPFLVPLYVPHFTARSRTHLSTRHRHEREVGIAPAGSGANAGLLGTLPAVKGTLRETSRHPPGVPQSWVRADLLELLTTVLLGAPSAWKENSTKLDFRVTEF